jgi:hypothetical protein
MYSVVFRNPASLLVFPFLCIVAWLIDDLPVINSRYVTHFVTIIGGCIYWLFATPSSVPRSFPYPFVVLVCNGVICGFFAGLLHRFLIARFILMMRAKFGDSPVATSLKSTNGENLLATKQSE